MFGIFSRFSKSNKSRQQWLSKIKIFFSQLNKSSNPSFSQQDNTHFLSGVSFVSSSFSSFPVSTDEILQVPSRIVLQTLIARPWLHSFRFPAAFSESPFGPAGQRFRKHARRVFAALCVGKALKSLYMRHQRRAKNRSPYGKKQQLLSPLSPILKMKRLAASSAKKTTMPQQSASPQSPKINQPTPHPLQQPAEDAKQRRSAALLLASEAAEAERVAEAAESEARRLLEPESNEKSATLSTIFQQPERPADEDAEEPDQISASVSPHDGVVAEALHGAVAELAECSLSSSEKISTEAKPLSLEAKPRESQSQASNLVNHILDDPLLNQAVSATELSAWIGEAIVAKGLEDRLDEFANTGLSFVEGSVEAEAPEEKKIPKTFFDLEERRMRKELGRLGVVTKALSQSDVFFEHWRRGKGYEDRVLPPTERAPKSSSLEEKTNYVSPNTITYALRHGGERERACVGALVDLYVGSKLLKPPGT